MTDCCSGHADLPLSKSDVRRARLAHSSSIDGFDFSLINNWCDSIADLHANCLDVHLLMVLSHYLSVSVAFFLLERRLPLLKRGSNESLCKYLSLDFSLLKNRSVFLLALTFAIFQLAFFIPLHHLPLYAQDEGVSERGAFFMPRLMH